ncbi:MAG: hypothetical protein C0488_03115, partial [Arthrobacter sp.]|nr:hypothetical protein [Arthrobacter sp.]
PRCPAVQPRPGAAPFPSSACYFAPAVTVAARPGQSLASHRKIADAIRSQDAEGAAEAMLAHIELVSDVELLR